MSTRTLLAAGAAALLSATAPAAASAAQTVRCAGDGDSCGATVKLAGGARDERVTVKLSDTDLSLAHVTAVGAVRGGWKISRAGFREGGSVYRFTLNAARRNPSGARLVLLFHRDETPLPGSGLGLGTRARAQSGWKIMKAIFAVGVGMKVDIVGGGSGTSNCTREETSESFTTRSNDEVVQLSYFAKGDGSCAIDTSFSHFKVQIRNPEGRLVGSGAIFFGQRYMYSDYVVDGSSTPWVGVGFAATERDGYPAAKITK